MKQPLSRRMLLTPFLLCSALFLSPANAQREIPEERVPEGFFYASVPSGILGGLVVYDAMSGDMRLNTLVDEESVYALSSSYFGQGDFVVVLTNDPDRCNGLSLEECRASPYYRQETPFSITPSEYGSDPESEREPS